MTACWSRPLCKAFGQLSLVHGSGLFKTIREEVGGCRKTPIYGFPMWRRAIELPGFWERWFTLNVNPYDLCGCCSFLGISFRLSRDGHFPSAYKSACFRQAPGDRKKGRAEWPCLGENLFPESGVSCSGSPPSPETGNRCQSRQANRSEHGRISICRGRDLSRVRSSFLWIRALRPTSWGSAVRMPCDPPRRPAPGGRPAW